MRLFKIALSALLLQALSISGFADDLFPKLLEDVTKIERPTICYNGRKTLRLVEWDGQNDRPLTDESTLFSTSPVWSPVGDKIAFVTYDIEKRSHTLVLADIATEKAINITEQFRHQNIVLGTPGWSPDGKWLLLNGFSAVQGSTRFDVFKYEISTGKLINLTNSPANDDGEAYWSPNGNQILFASYRGVIPDGTIDIYVMDSNGNNEVNLTNSDTFDRNISWSPDGKKISYIAVKRGDLEKGIPSRSDVFTMNPDGSGVERITFDTQRKHYTTWSPDSKWILYSSITDSWAIYRVHVETKEVVRMTFGDNGGVDPRFVLSGKSPYLSADPKGKKLCQWGAVKKAGDSPNNPTSQDSE